MEITIITPSFPYPKGGFLPGVEQYIKNLAIGLKKLNYNVKIVTTYWNGSNTYDNYEGIPILRVLDSKSLFGKIGSIFHLNYLTFGLNIIRRKNTKFFQNSDIIIIAVAIGFINFLKVKKFRLISIYHHFEVPKTFLDFLYLPFFHYLEKKQFKRQKIIITFSNSSKKDIIKNYKINEDKIKIIPHGIDINKFNPNKFSNKLRKKYGKYLVLYSGLMIKRKRVDILLKAISYVVKEIQDISFVLTGDGPLLNQFKNMAKDYGIEDYTHFLGFVSDDLLIKYFATSDLFVFPSELEGFGQVILEAMASGTPVICVNKPPMSEIIESGGLTFKLNDARDLAKKIVTLLKNKILLKELGAIAFKIAKEYDWNEITIKYNDLFRYLLEKPYNL